MAKKTKDQAVDAATVAEPQPIAPIVDKSKSVDLPAIAQVIKEMELLTPYAGYQSCIKKLKSLLGLT